MKTQTALTIQTQLANLKARVKKKEKLLSKKRRTAAVSERSQKRKDSERRQFLAGAYVLAALEKTGEEASKLKIGEQSLEQWLTRDADRVLFDLEVVRQEITGVADGQSTSGAADRIAAEGGPMEMDQEGIDFDEQVLEERLDGETEGAQFNLEPTPSETVTAPGEESSALGGETLAKVDTPDEMDLADHDSDLISLDEADDEQTQGPGFEDYFE